MGDSLEKNPFYRSLVTQFRELFMLANKECSMICIPRSASLKGVSLNKQFISSHLLKQSPLLKSHLVPLDTSQVVDVEVKDKKLLVNNKKCAKHHEIEIISSEDAFNSGNKMYHINVIDRPMTYPFIENIYQCGTGEAESSVITLNECKLYLMQISAQKFRLLLNAGQKLSRTLLITPNSLDQVSESCASFVEDQIRNFPFDEMSTDEDILKYSIESIFVSYLSDSIMKSIQVRHYDTAEGYLRRIALIHEKKLTLKHFGSQFDFKIDLSECNFDKITARLDSTITAIEKVTIFKDFVSSVRKLLEILIQKSRSPFDLSLPTPVLSEDLIAGTVIVLAELKNLNMYYHLKFVQMFGTQLPSADEMAFSLVTIEAAFQVIESFELCPSVEKRPKPTSSLDSIPLTSPTMPKKSDPKFDRKLRKLNKLLSDVTDGDGEKSSASISSRSNQNDDDLGEFLSSLHVSKFQF